MAKLYQESREEGEEELFQRLAEYSKDVVVARKNFLSGATQRDVHGKSVCALKAEFVVDDHVPAKYQYGVFAQKKSYPCWIRLSNSGQHPAKDHKPDIRGFAVKLMGVGGVKLHPEQPLATTHDFTFLTTENFFSRNTEQFFRLLKALNGNLFTFLWFGLTNPRAALAGVLGMKRFANLLGVQFWSTTPYRLGPTLAVKYSVKPQPLLDQSQIPDLPGRNYLRDAAARTLREREVVFDFLVQEQQSAFWNPIENGLVVWRENPLLSRLVPKKVWKVPARLRPKWLNSLLGLLPPKAPLVKVAEIRIPTQDVDMPDRNWMAENLSMNPWHAIEDHRPLGDLNRGRRLVYLEVAKFRRQRNLLPPLAEPVAGPDFFDDTGLAGQSPALAAGGNRS